MRIRITINARLLAETRGRAAASGLALGAIVEDALRATLDRPANVDRGGVATVPSRPSLPVFRGSRLVAGVDLDDSAALLELIQRAEP
jgi:hypothetical protein